LTAGAEIVFGRTKTIGINIDTTDYVKNNFSGVGSHLCR